MVFHGFVPRFVWPHKVVAFSMLCWFSKILTPRGHIPIRMGQVRKAYKNSAFEEIPPDRDLASLKEEFEDVAVWELVESLGTWRFDAGFLTLSCQHWAWRASHLSAPHTLQPSEDGRSQLDELMDQQKLELCYKVSGDSARPKAKCSPFSRD